MSRAYPPDFCTAATMAYMLDLAESTFNAYVANGHIPPATPVGKKRLWNRMKVLEALDASQNQGRDGPAAEDIRRGFNAKSKTGPKINSGQSEPA